MTHHYNNTTDSVGTHFLTAVPLIEEARKKFNLPSENWAYPFLHFGDPEDPYYAEIWMDGMDWTKNIWAVRTIRYGAPEVVPLAYFDDLAQRDKFNSYDYRQFLRGCLWNERERTWLKNGDDGVFNDTVWSYLKMRSGNETAAGMIEVRFEHASQEPVDFSMNMDFYPAMRND